MAKVIGRKKPLLSLSYSEVMALKRYVERARQKEEEDMKATEERIAAMGDLVEIAGHTYSRAEWVLQNKDNIEEMDGIIAALAEYKHRIYRRGGGESCMRSSSTPASGGTPAATGISPGPPKG